jgi:hypothetical protein
VNTRGSSSFLNHYSAVNRYIGCISIADLGFTPDKPGLNSVVFVLSINGMSVAS